MEEDAAVGEIMAVSETYRDEIENGDVERLLIVLVGPPRAMLETSGRVFAPEEVVETSRQLEATPASSAIGSSLPNTPVHSSSRSPLEVSTSCLRRCSDRCWSTPAPG